MLDQTETKVNNPEDIQDVNVEPKNDNNAQSKAWQIDRKDNGLEIVVRNISKLSFSSMQNKVKTITDLEIRNNSTTSFHEIDLKIESNPPFLFPFSQCLDYIPSESRMSVDLSGLQMDGSYLASLTEGLSGTILFSLCRAGEELTVHRTAIDVLPYDQWTGNVPGPELLAAFVTPNNPEIARICQTASILLEKWTGDQSLNAYQSRNPDRVKQQVAAIYGALQQCNFTYVEPPPNFEEAGQRIRLCDTMLEQRQGTCLDLALLYAGCLEYIGLHPLLVLFHRHCFIGCLLEEENFPEILQDDVSLLTKRVAAGIQTAVVVECTLLCSGSDASFDLAVKNAERQLYNSNEFDYFLDVRRARASRIKPIPARVRTTTGWEVVYEDRNEDELTDAPAPIFRTELATIENAGPQTRKDLWEKNLLDLSLRNNLLNMRINKSTVPILTDDPKILEDAFAGIRCFHLLCRPEQFEYPDDPKELFETRPLEGALAELLALDRRNGRLRTVLSETDLPKRLAELYRRAKTSQEESGATTLYLSFGTLRWFESPSSQKPRYAPLVLIPVELVRQTAQKGYLVQGTEAEAQINVTLLEFLRHEFKIVLPGLETLPADESGIDLARIFTIFRHNIMNQKGWDILENTFLGIFSFSQFVMWNDLHSHLGDLERNRVVSSLLAGQLTWTPEPIEEQNDWEGASIHPINADASQLKAIYAAGADRTFVLHGPPGTGKSQTITNIIADVLAQGKTILFVAEKMAALAVVQKRLQKIGLGPFCLELHSNKSTKKNVLDQLQRALNSSQKTKPDSFQEKQKHLAELRDELGQYVSILHSVNRCGQSLYELIATNQSFSDDLPELSIPKMFILNLTETKNRDFRERLATLLALIANMPIPDQHPLRALGTSEYSQQLRMEFPKKIGQLEKTIRLLEKSLNPILDAYCLNSPQTMQDFLALVDFAPIALKTEAIPDIWLAVEELENGQDQTQSDLPEPNPEKLMLKECNEDNRESCRNKVDYSTTSTVDCLKDLDALADALRREDQLTERIRQNWDAPFFELNAEELLTLWDRLFEREPDSPQYELLPVTWFDPVNLEEKLEKLVELAVLSRKSSEESRFILDFANPDFLEQNVEQLKSEWNAINAKSFIPKCFAKFFFLRRIRVFFHKKTATAILSDLLDRVTVFQTAKRTIAQLRPELDDRLQSFLNADDSINSDKLERKARYVLSHFEDFLRFIAVYKERCAFKNRLTKLTRLPFDRTFIKESLDLLSEYRLNRSTREKLESVRSAQLAGFWNGNSIDQKAFLPAVDNAICCQKELNSLLNNSNSIYKSDSVALLRQCAKVKKMKLALDEFQDSWRQFQTVYEDFRDYFILDESRIDFASGLTSALQSLCSIWRSSQEELRRWVQWRGFRKTLLDEGMDSLVEAYENGMKPDRLEAALEKSLSRALILLVFEENTDLNQFSGETFEEKIKMFAKLEEEYSRLTCQEIQFRLASRVSNPARALPGSELAVLRRVIHGRGRGCSIRRLFDQIPTLLKELCPCILMSPISVAQYLTTDREPFDLVVFDEASQLTTCKAVGALARGKNAVIVGDPKQLPPTNFFVGNANDDEEEQIELGSLESILDDCLALSVPEMHLLWHYRSRHESLIAFSNREFYDNSLLTFPSVNDRISKVRFIEVPGFYDRSKTRTNAFEAEAIIQEVLARLRDPDLSKKSIGIVTFSIVQQRLIEDRLEEVLREFPELEAKAFDREEPLFIKNLENVQGDERDVILFSVCYAPDENGRFFHNFGPLNREGGQRRLNVAVTRAREEMLVFSTLLPDQIDLDRTLSVGVAKLKSFLEFARGGAQTAEPFIAGKKLERDRICRIIADYLAELGFESRLNIGRSGFRVDLGVVHPDAPDRYLLGILLDGENYKNAKTTRDRELTPVQVLQGLGWRVHRLWSLDWWDNRNGELRKIKNFLQKALDEDRKNRRTLN